MAQYLKINSQVLNADTIIAAYPFDSGDVGVVTTSTRWSPGNEQQINMWKIDLTTTESDKRDACIADINKALTGKPGGRVVEVAKSSVYTINQIRWEGSY